MGSQRERLLGRILRLGRMGRAAPAGAADDRRRLEAVEARLDDLETLVQGLQDSVHRESVRQAERIRELEKRIQPSEISRALSEDARERGI